MEREACEYLNDTTGSALVMALIEFLGNALRFAAMRVIGRVGGGVSAGGRGRTSRRKVSTCGWERVQPWVGVIERYKDPCPWCDFNEYCHKIHKTQGKRNLSSK